jgi:hypothetical protein
MTMPDRIVYYTWSIRTVSPFAVPLFSSSATTLAAVEDQLTSLVRNKTAGEEGTYTSLAWIPLESSKHLHIDVRLQDEPAAQVLLCFPTFNDDVPPLPPQVKCFSFAMQRGSNPLCNVVLQFFASTFGCVFSNRPFSPTPNQVAHALAVWTTHQSTLTKPLEVTFCAPDAIASAGLEKLSLTVPPVAIARLLQDMQKYAADTSSQELPILRALHCFILETYNLRIESFALVRATSAAAMLGCDGRCKPLDKNTLTSVLSQIQSMIQSQIRIGAEADMEEQDVQAQDE